jgi:flagellar hook protein FlgE
MKVRVVTPVMIDETPRANVTPASVRLPAASTSAALSSVTPITTAKQAEKHVTQQQPGQQSGQLRGGQRVTDKGVVGGGRILDRPRIALVGSRATGEMRSVDSTEYDVPSRRGLSHRQLLHSPPGEI